MVRSPASSASAHLELLVLLSRLLELLLKRVDLLLRLAQLRSLVLAHTVGLLADGLLLATAGS